jgi:glycosyltransferase involved in cell wall biosynthesis
LTQRTVVISINAAWNIFNFRRGLIRALLGAGYRVVALAPPDGYEQRLIEIGAEFLPLPMDAGGTSPVRDALLLIRYLRRLRQLRPAVFLGYTAKPNVFGSLAAHALGIPVINNIAGLGTAVLARGRLAAILLRLYRFALRRSRTVFFQNADDLGEFVGAGIVRPEQARRLPGSGVDLSHFCAAMPSATDRPTFLLIARLLRDKGVIEYVEAARIVRRKCPAARFQLLGFLGVANPTAISRDELENWVTDGLIEYLGDTDDVRPAIAAADCVVLPSYREGVPRSLLEAAAMARPLIASDVPGCRDVVRAGINGFLHPARNAEALADTMLEFIALSDASRATLGHESRALAEREFDERLVIAAYLRAIEDVIGPT